MGKKYVLQIPKPCNQSWDDMTAHEKGKFCSSCQKHVVDFTNMSDEEIIKQISSVGKNGLCGRFTSNQINRELLPVKTSQSLIFPRLLASILSLTAISPNIAAAKPNPDYTEVAGRFKSKPLEVIIGDTIRLNNTFSGVVVDSITKMPLRNINVWLEETGTSVYTNDAGEFAFIVPDSFFSANQRLIFHFEWEIYPVKSYTFFSYNLPQFRLVKVDRDKAFKVHDYNVSVGMVIVQKKIDFSSSKPKRIFPQKKSSR